MMFIHLVNQMATIMRFKTEMRPYYLLKYLPLNNDNQYYTSRNNKLNSFLYVLLSSNGLCNIKMRFLQNGTGKPAEYKDTRKCLFFMT